MTFHRLLQAEQQKVDSKDLDGLTALHYAAGNGQVHVVKWLVNHGAKMLVDFVGGTPLHTAAHNGSSEVRNIKPSESKHRFLFTLCVTRSPGFNMESSANPVCVDHITRFKWREFNIFFFSK